MSELFHMETEANHQNMTNFCEIWKESYFKIMRWFWIFVFRLRLRKFNIEGIEARRIWFKNLHVILEWFPTKNVSPNNQNQLNHIWINSTRRDQPDPAIKSFSYSGKLKLQTNNIFINPLKITLNLGTRKNIFITLKCSN